MTHCPICATTSVRTIQEPWEVFRHLDFSNMERTLSLLYCEKCALFFKSYEETSAGPLEECSSVEYAQSRQTAQTKLVPEFPEPVTRSFLQAELLQAVIHSPAPRVLDIGCFDGALLLELEKRFPESVLHGFDVNPHLEQVFPTGERYTFYSDSLSEIENSYDLICLSHSLMYISDLHSLVLEIKRLLKQDGAVFTQNTNIAMSPCFLLLGDQYNFFTPAAISSLFATFGFGTELLQSDWFPREFATLSTAGSASRLADDGCALEALTYLQAASQKLQETLEQRRVGVLGTTANAAFVSSVLSKNDIFFVDENTAKIGTLFRDCEVIHPDALEDEDLVVIPFGTTSEAIRERFSNSYRGTFFCI